MSPYRLQKIVRWIAAGSIATGACWLCVREGRASQSLIVEAFTSNPNCTFDSNHNYLYAEAWAISQGNRVWTAGMSMENGVGGTAFNTPQISFVPDQQEVIIAGYNSSTGQMGPSLCNPQRVSWTSTSTCAITPPAINGCPANSEVAAESYGVNF